MSAAVFVTQLLGVLPVGLFIIFYGSAKALKPTRTPSCAHFLPTPNTAVSAREKRSPTQQIGGGMRCACALTDVFSVVVVF